MSHSSHRWTSVPQDHSMNYTHRTWPPRRMGRVGFGNLHGDLSVAVSSTPGTLLPPPGRGNSSFVTCRRPVAVGSPPIETKIKTGSRDRGQAAATLSQHVPASGLVRAGGGCGIRTREGLPPTRFPSPWPPIHGHSRPSVQAGRPGQRNVLNVGVRRRMRPKLRPRRSAASAPAPWSRASEYRETAPDAPVVTQRSRAATASLRDAALPGGDFVRVRVHTAGGCGTKHVRHSSAP